MPTASHKKARTSKSAKSAKKIAGRKPARAERRPVAKGAARPDAAKGRAGAALPPAKPPAKAPAPAVPVGKAGSARTPAKPASGAAATGPATKPRPAARKSSRRSSLSLRRGPDGELLAPGELLLPGGPQSVEEVQYLLRGVVAAEHGDVDAGIAEVIAKHPTPGDPLASRPDLAKQAQAADKRFASGTIEPLLPTRIQSSRRTFASVVERAKMRRREIGAFLRGLHLGHTETSHMDSHGEASLQSLMEWAARLENLMEAEEPNQADYSQFHRGLDHLENTTEALIVDVEGTLRRLRDRVGSR